MKNNIQDLNNYLFEQLERLQDDTLSDEELERELKRSEKIASIGKVILQTKSLQINTAMELSDKGYINNNQTINLLTGKKNEELL